VAFLRVCEAAEVRREQGLLAALKFGAAVARAYARERSIPRKLVKTSSFDTQYGTDTAGNAKLHNLHISSPNYQYGVYYRATNYSVLMQILDRLSLQHGNYSFVDYGSGKGLVVLKAAGFPFKKVIGVEFAKELHETAVRNVKRHPASLRHAPIELVHADALDFIPPPGDLVLYLYEPFEPPVTRQLIGRIDQFRGERDVVVAYVWSDNKRLTSKPLWDSVPFLSKVDAGQNWTIYRTRFSPVSA
jgi:hypothetical protein